MTREALDLKISGVVQGVGFRPFVYREAKKRDITGWVLNDVEGVRVHAEGETLPLDRFVPVSYTHLDVYKRQALGAVHCQTVP